VVTVEIILVKHATHGLSDLHGPLLEQLARQHAMLLANGLAQSRALMQGKRPGRLASRRHPLRQRNSRPADAGEAPYLPRRRVKHDLAAGSADAALARRADRAVRAARLQQRRSMGHQQVRPMGVGSARRCSTSVVPPRVADLPNVAVNMSALPPCAREGNVRARRIVMSGRARACSPPSASGRLRARWLPVALLGTAVRVGPLTSRRSRMSSAGQEPSPVNGSFRGVNSARKSKESACARRGERHCLHNHDKAMTEAIGHQRKPLLKFEPPC